MPSDSADWIRIRDGLRAQTDPCTQMQLDVGRTIGLDLHPDTPRLVAAARIHRAVSEEYLPEVAAKPTQSQMSRLSALFVQSPPEPRDRLEADAWIEVGYVKRRVQALNELQLTPGDVLSVQGSSDPLTISSIGDDGRIYFKGGKRAWPDNCQVLARYGDDSPASNSIRQAADNAVAREKATEPAGPARSHHLSAWEISDRPDSDDLDLLSETIEDSQDERPIQRLLQDRPRILTVVAHGAHGQYVRPNVKLSDKYVADFMIATVDSRGIRWLFLELESPRAEMTLKTQDEFSKEARRGIAQVQEWREFCTNNLAHADRPISQGGLGLVGVRPESEGLVLVSRREKLRENASWIRHRLEQERRITIHTYDWLLERVRRALDGDGYDSGRL